MFRKISVSKYTRGCAAPVLLAGSLFSCPSFVSATDRDGGGGNAERNLFNNTATVLTAPLSWEKNDWRRFGTVAGVTAGTLFIIDKNHDNYTKNIGGDVDYISEKAKFFGDGLFILPFCGAAYAYGKLTGRTRLPEAAAAGAQSYLISGLVVTMIKFAVHRPRPNKGGEYSGFEEQSFFSGENLSFPSGHTASAFAVASVTGYYYGDSPWKVGTAYALAGLVGWSRFNDHDHWPSDVFAGAALGYYIGKKVSALNNGGADGLSLVPVDIPGGQGFGLASRF